LSKIGDRCIIPGMKNIININLKKIPTRLLFKLRHAIKKYSPDLYLQLKGDFDREIEARPVSHKVMGWDAIKKPDNITKDIAEL